MCHFTHSLFPPFLLSKPKQSSSSLSSPKPNSQLQMMTTHTHSHSHTREGSTRKRRQSRNSDMAVAVKKRSDGATIGLSDLPEGCIANALSLTIPREVCRLSPVCSAFRSAAPSYDVWEWFLQADYRDILGRSADGMELLGSSLNKKLLFLRLCDNRILIDGVTKSFSLDKSRGEKCYMLAAKDKSIVWSDTPEYWQWIPQQQSELSAVQIWTNLGEDGAVEGEGAVVVAAGIPMRESTLSFSSPRPPMELTVLVWGEERKEEETV